MTTGRATGRGRTNKKSTYTKSCVLVKSARLKFLLLNVFGKMKHDKAGLVIQMLAEIKHAYIQTRLELAVLPECIQNSCGK